LKNCFDFKILFLIIWCRYR